MAKKKKYTYKGTKITETSTKAKVFKESGIKDAKKNETYMNTQVGHVYKCTEGGKPEKAKWIYKKTLVIKKPSIAVAKLGNPVRQSGNRKMKAEWQIPKKLTDATMCDRAGKVDVTWKIKTSASRKPSTVEDDKKIKETSSTIDLDNFKVGSTTYRRNSFFPMTAVKLEGVSVTVNPKNAKGAGGQPATQERKFTAPRKPSIAGFAFNTETGVASSSINTDAGADYQERYDTEYLVTITDTNQKKTWQHIPKSTNPATSIPISYNASNYQNMMFGQYIRIHVDAWARGYMGYSPKSERDFYISYPAQATLGTPTVTGKTARDKCTIPVATNSKTEHPVDRIRLEYLANVNYATEDSIPGDATWTSTDIVDDAACTALAIGVADLIPDPGKYTWVRAKTYYLSETVLYRYSNYQRVRGLETPMPTAADDDIVILSATAGADGESAVVVLGWNEDGQDDSDGTELTWSDAEDAWRSTDDPDAYEFTWSDGPRSEGGHNYRDSATITIKGLREGTKYYIRARRYMDGEVRTYSEYSNIATALTSEIPSAVIASCDRYVPVGASLPVSWTFSGNGIQTQWQIMVKDGTYEPTEDTEPVVNKWYYERSGSGTEQDPYVYTAVNVQEGDDPAAMGLYEFIIGAGPILAEGKGGMTSTQIDAIRLADFAIDGSTTFTVQVSTGSGFVISEEHTVTIQDPPTLTITVPQALTAQPETFTAEASSECDLIVIVTAQGAVGQFPEGLRRQPAGDTVYSGIIVPEWAGNGPYTTTITLPGGLDLWDLARYNVSVVAVDRSTGLQSTEQVAEFGVAWAHQAPSIEPTYTYTPTSDTEIDDTKNYYALDPETQTYSVVEPEGGEDPSAEGWYEQTETTYVTLTPINTLDEEGIHHQAVQINLTPPPGAAETDYYDIYRMTGDGAYLIGQSFPQTYVATDEYAPFGDALTLYYRIATRTIDGDVAFTDIEYVADGSAMRFDWAGGSLELPYNISIGDSYKKDVNFRKHMGGSIDGYWNSNIERKGSLSSDLVRLDQQEDVVMARQLAHYAGPVFVRTPDGSAYEADVQVTDMSTTGTLEAIAIDATEIGLTQEFILPTPYPLVEEE